MSITDDTRRKSYEINGRSAGKASKIIYNALLFYGRGSAWQIAAAIRRPVYVVRPRITELCKAGRIKAIGTRVCEETKRSEAVWDVVDKQLKLV